MTVEKLCSALNLEVLCMPEPDREITGGYAGDLLSWVMGRVSSGEAWITIMTNVNIIAVATLSDPSCIILSEGVEPDKTVRERAEAHGINLLRSPKSTFQLCADVASLL